VDTPRAADVGDVDRWWIHLERLTLVMWTVGEYTSSG
jgi:hypothetical protein